jgi:O-antigen/teichoic acid export membrane protein
MISSLIILTISSFAVNVLNYLFNVLAGRSLGPTGYGDISALFSYISIISVPVTILSTIVIQKIASSEKDKYSYARSIELFFWSKMRRVWWILIPIAVVIPYISHLTNLSIASSYSLVPIIILSFLSSLYGATLQGMSLFFLFSVIAVGAALIKLSGAILSMFLLSGVATIVTLIVISLLFSFLLGKYFLDHSSKHLEKSSVGIEKRLLDVVTSRQFIITTISIFGLTLLSNIDIVFVKKFFTAQEAGIYGSWSLFAKIILYFVGPLTAVTLVYFAKQSNKEMQGKTLLMSLGLLAIIGIASYVGYTYFSSLLITLLFGSKFIALLPYLSYASIFGTLYATITLLNNYFLAKKSAASLALPIGMAVYIAALFLIDKSLLALMYLNIIFATIITVVYLYLYFNSLKKHTS